MHGMKRKSGLCKQNIYIIRTNITFFLVGVYCAVGNITEV